jgi:alkaline phosphatase
MFIGDGMGLGQVALAESYISYQEGRLGGASLSFTQFPVYGLCKTYSADHNITCSAASGTAIACGEKTKNGHVGVDASGCPMKSVATILKEEGYKVGIMTNVQVNHATPAAFYGQQSDRNNYYEIGQELPSSGFEFFAGSGFYKSRGLNGDREPLGKYVEDNGYEVCYGIDEFNAAKDSSDKIVFIQASGRKEETDFYVSNGKDDEEIGLDAMLKLGIDFLGDEEPFFIMCEGGEIDWAAHENLVMPMVQEILNFDEVIQTAVEFYKEHPEETLIIVTGDHETGGPTIGEGVEWREEFIGWQQIEKNWIESGCRNNLSYEENKAMNSKALIGWTSCHHTGAPVPVYAIGKGAEKFHGRIDNTDIKGIILGE